MKRKIPILLFVVAVAAALAAWRYTPLWKRPAPALNQLKLSGNVEAHESQLSFKASGRIVALPVEEGQRLERGALLARLDEADYQQRVAVDAASVRVREANLALLEAGSRAQEVKASEQAMQEAHAELEQKKLDNERAQKLFAKDEISAQDRDLAATALKRATAAWEASRQRYSQIKEGARKEDIAIARANVRAAEETLRLSRVNLDYTRLYAPFDGVVTVRQAELGEVVSPGTPVVTLADLDHVWLRAYVAETDLGRIRWGQNAVVSTDTYPGKQYRGRISFISPEAEFTPKSVQTTQERVTLVYRIKVEVDNPQHELKPGMPADLRIDLAAPAAGR